MPFNSGHINYALVERSKRLQRVIELLQKADHPLSGMEIQIQAWVTNASTSIAEIRGEKNRNAGYEVSKAASWKGLRYSWHDGNPRYWLIAAPGWTPRWRIDAEGVILPCTAFGTVKSVELGVGVNIVGSKELVAGVNAVGSKELGVQSNKRTTGPGSPCKLQRCGRPIPDGKPQNAEYCCTAHHDEYWKVIRDMGKSVAAAGQGKLF
jgi:hypothetical protein